MMQFVQVDAELLGKMWQRIQPKLKAAYERSAGRMDAISTFNLIHSGYWVLWVAIDVEADDVFGVVISSVEKYPTDKKFTRINILAGKDRNEWLHFIEDIERWGEKQGCEGIEIMSHKNWVRDLPDYKTTHVLIGKDL